jgi:hypothetical protein
VFLSFELYQLLQLLNATAEYINMPKVIIETIITKVMIVLENRSNFLFVTFKNIKERIVPIRLGSKSPSRKSVNEDIGLDWKLAMILVVNVRANTTIDTLNIICNVLLLSISKIVPQNKSHLYLI